jgi:hypothetical protein
MGRRSASGDGPDQGWLVSPDPRQRLPERQLAWGVLDQVRQVGLWAFRAACRADRQGGKPYDPAMMCGLLLYGWCKRLRSCRDIEMAAFGGAGARVICGDLHPDRCPAADFIRGAAELSIAVGRDGGRGGLSRCRWGRGRRWRRWRVLGWPRPAGAGQCGRAGAGPPPPAPPGNPATAARLACTASRMPGLSTRECGHGVRQAAAMDPGPVPVMRMCRRRGRLALLAVDFAELVMTSQSGEYL